MACCTVALTASILVRCLTSIQLLGSIQSFFRFQSFGIKQPGPIACEFLYTVPPHVRSGFRRIFETASWLGLVEVYLGTIPPNSIEH